MIEFLAGAAVAIVAERLLAPHPGPCAGPHVAPDTVRGLEDNLTKLRDEATALRAEGANLRDQLAALKAKLQEQNDADLLLVSMRLTKKIIDGAPREEVDPLRVQQEHLVRMQQQLGGARGPMTIYGSQFSSALFGGIR